MLPELTQDQGTLINALVDAPVHEATPAGELARLYGARIHEYCSQFLRDPERARVVCEQALAEATAELATSVQIPRVHDWLRRIADRRCHASVEAHVLVMLDRGDRRAAETELYEAYGIRILGFCRQLLRDVQAAEDAAQQALLQACRDLEQRRGSLYAWMRGIARNRCLDAIRRRQLEARLASTQDVESECLVLAPDAQLDRRRLYAELLECVRQLSPRNRNTVILRFVDDEASYAELAVLLGENSATLNRRVNRSMKSLRECLASKGRR